MTQKVKQNIYDFYISKLKEKQKKGFALGQVFHKHHILPKHAGGLEEGEVVICTPRDHARAHYFRYLVYGDYGDLAAYYGLRNRSDQMLQAISAKIVAVNKERGNCMFNDTWQKEMGNRPKKSYYLRDNQNYALQMGKKGGNKSAQIKSEKNIRPFVRDSKTIEMLSKQLTWEHDTGIKVISPPIPSIGKLKNFLNEQVPGSVKTSGGLSGLLRGVHSKRFGWKMIQSSIVE